MTNGKKERQIKQRETYSKCHTYKEFVLVEQNTAFQHQQHLMLPILLSAKQSVIDV